MLSKKLFTLVFFICFMGSVVAKAQTYPVSGSLTLNAPYSALLGQYTQAGSTNILLTTTLLDQSESTFPVRFHLKIESSSLLLETKTTFRGKPVTLMPNSPVTMFGYDLSEYFNLNNLDIKGISRQQLERSKKLPEGQYTFCITILDDITGRPVSREICASAWIQLKDPPLVISPQCGNTVMPLAGPNILFQWQNQGSISPNSAMNTQYELSLFEITDDNIEPLYALENRKTLPIFNSGFNSNTTYLYSLSDPTLELGKRYLFRVQAKDQNGLDEFKNDGYSEVCYFNYGYPEGGVITLIEPKKDASFSKNDDRYFKWSASNKMQDNQSVTYSVTLTLMNEGQTASTAMDLNDPWKVITTSPTTTPDAYDAMLNDTFPKDREMAWKVEAFSGKQLVASSEVLSFKTPPAIASFKAGEHFVEVTEISDKTLSNFSGKGRLKIGGTDSSFVEVSFEKLSLKKTAGRFVLDGGEINTEVNMDTIGLTALHKDVPNGVFHPKAIKLDKEALSIKGYAAIPLPISTNSTGSPSVITTTDWVPFDSYVLKGSLKLDGTKNAFELLDPLGFKVSYDETSELTVSSNKFTLDLKGKITLPKSVKSTNGQEVSFDFSEQDNFSYGTIRAIQDAHIKVSEATEIFYTPSEAILDFSSAKSPDKYSGNKEWTGLYFTKGTITIPEQFDPSGQLVLAATKEIAADLSKPYIKQTEVTGAGLSFECNLETSHKLLLTANTFKGRIKKMNLSIDEGEIQPADIEIEAIVPFVSNAKTFDVNFPLKESGVEKGYFASKVNETIVFDEDDDQRKTEVKVSQLKFDENNNIDMSVDIKNTYTGLSLTKLQNFKVDATGNVGFKAVGQPMALETKANVKVGGIPLDIDSIAFGKVKGNYGVGFSGAINLGPMASGKEGALRTTIVSAISPGAAVDANASVSADFDAAKMEGSASAEANGSVEGNLGGVAKGGASGEASASGSIGKDHIRGDVGAGAKANISSPILNDVIGGVNSICGGLLKTHDYEAELGAGAGGGAKKTKHGFMMDAYVNLDVIVAKAAGKVELEADQRWGAVLKGNVLVEGAFVKIKNLEGIEGQLIYGMKEGRPIVLLRGALDVAIPIVPPYIGLKNLGFAVGVHTAPETFTPEDFTPASSVDWDVDVTTPLAFYVSAGIADGVPTFGGIVYEAQQSGGGFAQGVDITKPSTYTDLQLCMTQSMQGGVFNVARGPLALIMAEKSILYVQGQTENCYGKVMSAKGRVKGSLMVTPVIPICAEGTLNFHTKMDFGKIANPKEFASSFLYKVQFGTKANPLNVSIFCDPGMKLVKGWLDFQMKDGYAFIDAGAGIDIDKRWAVPKIRVGELGDYIAPYFELKAKLIGSGEMKLPLAAITEPDASARLMLNVHANLYSELGVEYQILGKESNLQLGKVNLLIDGTFEHEISKGKDLLVLDGKFVSEFRLLGHGYKINHEGSLPVNLSSGF